jgi:hypothetical protein
MSHKNHKHIVPSKVLEMFSTACPERISTGGMTVLIPIRGANRNQNLEIIIPYVLAQNIEPLEILIVEQDVVPTIKLNSFKEYLNIHHIFLKEGGPFNKARVMNAGTAHAQYEKICMIDVDMIIEKGLLYKISMILNASQVCFSIHEIYFLTEVPTNSNYVHDGKTWATTAPFNCHGGIVAYNRKAFIDIGGMNEEFVGHGSEDTEFYERAKRLLKFSDERFATTLHIPHPRDTSHAAGNHERCQSLKREKIENTVQRLKTQFQKNWGSVLNGK